MYGHLPSITKTIKIRRARHAGHCWRSRDELVSDVLIWTPSHGQAKAGRPARTYIQQLCEDMGCSSEEQPEAMNDRKWWQERVRDIRVDGTTRWWWDDDFYLSIVLKHAALYRRNKDELINYILLWTPIHGHTSTCHSVKTNIH